MSKKIKLGLIGLSPGNGHPYSWSAIINGYNKSLMKKCEFPIIYEYLKKKKFPHDQIKNAEVTHIWTQNLELSKKIARTTKIKYVVNNYKELLGKVDAILLARDDADNHIKYSRIFLENKMPIYIDKPLAFSVKKATKIISLQKYNGQIFSCSALHYAREFKISVRKRKKIGRIKSVYAFVPNDWKKYSVHVIDPLVKILPNRGPILKVKKYKNDHQTILTVKYKNNLILNIISTGLGNTPISIRIIGTRGYLDLITKNYFKCFKDTLYNFISSVKNKQSKISMKKTLEIVKLIELGR